MRPAQILEERLLLRTFFSTISLWVSLLMDKGSSIVKRFSRISGQHQTFAAASDIFRSIFLKRKSELTYTEKWKTNDFSNREERKRAEVTHQLCAQCFGQGYSWVFRRSWVSGGLGGSALSLTANISGYRTGSLQNWGKITTKPEETPISVLPIHRAGSKLLPRTTAAKSPGDHLDLCLSPW